MLNAQLCRRHLLIDSQVAPKHMAIYIYQKIQNDGHISSIKVAYTHTIFALIDILVKIEIGIDLWTCHWKKLRKLHSWAGIFGLFLLDPPVYFHASIAVFGTTLAAWITHGSMWNAQHVKCKTLQIKYVDWQPSWSKKCITLCIELEVLQCLRRMFFLQGFSLHCLREICCANPRYSETCKQRPPE